MEEQIWSPNMADFVEGFIQWMSVTKMKNSPCKFSAMSYSTIIHLI